MPCLDLNYPSFIAIFNANESKVQQEFQRLVTSVGEGRMPSTYTTSVTLMRGLKVSVSPYKLAFKGKYTKQSWKLSIKVFWVKKQ